MLQGIPIVWFQQRGEELHVPATLKIGCKCSFLFPIFSTHQPKSRQPHSFCKNYVCCETMHVRFADNLYLYPSYH
jgi:hypothetical protein